MVKIDSWPLKGNPIKYFPTAGYLGVTPVVIQGKTVCWLEEDRRPVPATKVVVRVRCYEHSAKKTTGRGNILYEKELVLWDQKDVPNKSAEGGSNYADMGDFEQEWSISIPVEAVREGALSSAVQKAWGVQWMLESCILHMSLDSYGHQRIKSYRLWMPNYAPLSPRGHLQWTHFLPCDATLNINATTQIYGPQDRIHFFYAFSRTDNQVRRITVELQRELVSFRPESDPPRSKSLPELHAAPSKYLEISSESIPADLSKLGVTNSLLLTIPPPRASQITRNSSFDIPTDAKKVKLESSIVTKQTLRKMNGQGGMGVLELTVPECKSRALYGVGETMAGQYGNMRFYIQIKIYLLKSRKPIFLPRKEVWLSSLTKKQRDAAAKVTTIAIPDPSLLELVRRPCIPLPKPSADPIEASRKMKKGPRDPAVINFDLKLTTSDERAALLPTLDTQIAPAKTSMMKTLCGKLRRR